MALKNELQLHEDFESTSHEALLAIYFTASRIRKQADEFFKRHGLTDVQFNVLMLLHYQGRQRGGITQIQLSRMMLVNRANVTALIDRMQKTRLVERTGVPGDRRCNLIVLTTKGRQILKKVEKDYMDEVERIMGALDREEMKTLSTLLERVRGRIDDTTDQ